VKGSFIASSSILPHHLLPHHLHQPTTFFLLLLLLHHHLLLLLFLFFSSSLLLFSLFSLFFLLSSSSSFLSFFRDPAARCEYRSRTPCCVAVEGLTWKSLPVKFEPRSSDESYLVFFLSFSLFFQTTPFFNLTTSLFQLDNFLFGQDMVTRELNAGFDVKSPRTPFWRFYVVGDVANKPGKCEFFVVFHHFIADG